MDAFRAVPKDMQSMFRVDHEKVKSFCCISKCFQSYEHKEVTYCCVEPHSNIFTK